MRHLQAERQTAKGKEDAISELDKPGGKPNRFVAGCRVLMPIDARKLTLLRSTMTPRWDPAMALN